MPLRLINAHSRAPRSLGTPHPRQPRLVTFDLIDDSPKARRRGIRERGNTRGREYERERECERERIRERGNTREREYERERIREREGKGEREREREYERERIRGKENTREREYERERIRESFRSRCFAPCICVGCMLPPIEASGIPCNTFITIHVHRKPKQHGMQLYSLDCSS